MVAEAVSAVRTLLQAGCLEQQPASSRPRSLRRAAARAGAVVLPARRRAADDALARFADKRPSSCGRSTSLRAAPRTPRSRAKPGTPSTSASTTRRHARPLDRAELGLMAPDAPVSSASTAPRRRRRWQRAAAVAAARWPLAPHDAAAVPAPAGGGRGGDVGGGARPLHARPLSAADTSTATSSMSPTPTPPPRRRRRRCRRSRRGSRWVRRTLAASVDPAPATPRARSAAGGAGASSSTLTTLMRTTTRRPRRRRRRHRDCGADRAGGHAPAAAPAAAPSLAAPSVARPRRRARARRHA